MTDRYERIRDALAMGRRSKENSDLTPERLAELRRNDEVASHDGGRLYRLKSDYSLEYWRGALEGAFKECEQIERALGLPPEVTIIYTRLKQWESLLNWLEEVRDGVEGIKLREDAEYFAACDPDTIRALLAERDALAAEVERLAEALRELEERAQRDEALLRQVL